MNEYVRMIPDLSDQQLVEDAVDVWPLAWAGKCGAIEAFSAIRSELRARGYDLARVPGPAGRALRVGE